MKEIDIDLFKLEHNNIMPSQGKVLLSLPFLNDAYFKKTAILLAEHSDDGSIGFILNRPHRYKLHDLIDGVSNKNFVVSFGGPVSSDTLFFIHTLGRYVPNSLEIAKGIYWGGEFSVVKEMLKNDEVTSDNIRFFLGYSGWGAQQLKDEIDADTWLVSDLSSSDIMHNSDDKFWNYALKKMGDKYAYWSTFPDDPSYN